MTQPSISAADATRLAENAFASGLADDPRARAGGRLLSPLAIVTPEGEPWGWMVPLAQADRLVGFVQVTGTGEVRRYASFQRRPGDIESCPTAASWTDPATIRARAATAASQGEVLSEPVLTYDRSPDRLFWKVVATAGDGRARVIAVAGQTVWT